MADASFDDGDRPTQPAGVSVGLDLFRMAWPSVVSSVVQQATGLMTIFFVSSLDDAYVLGSVGLGSMFQNVFGFSLGAGLNSALDTLVSQSFGAGEYERTGEFLRQAQLLSLAVSVPCAVALLFAGDFFVAVGIDARTARDAGDYVRGTLPAMPLFFLYTATRLFLRSVKVPQPDSYVSIAAVAVHPIWCVLFLWVLRWGSFGAGLTVTCSNCVRFVLLTGYTAMARPGPCGKYWRCFPRLRPIAAGSQPGFRTYLAVAIPSALLMWSEWWVYEVMSLLAGICGTVALAAHTAVCNLLLILFMVPVAVGSASSTLVGNAMGAGEPVKAKLVIHFACRFALALFLVLALAVLLLRRELALLFSTQPDVVATFQRLSFLLAPFLVLDALQTVIEGALRGLGQQDAASKVKLVSMCGVRMVGAWALALPGHLGIEGVWLGGLCGMVVTLLLYGMILRRADFAQISSGIRGGLLQLRAGTPAPPVPGEE